MGSLKGFLLGRICGEHRIGRYGKDKRLVAVPGCGD
jgi:hypothetical protein